MKPHYETGFGKAYLGDSLEVIPRLGLEGSVDLIMTSPPFALTRKKEYGNQDAHEYVDWFMQFAPVFHGFLKDTGSFVLDLGGSWVPGLPIRTTYIFELVLALTRSDSSHRFYLAQDFFWYNPSRLPTPAEWVTVRRIRVKDAVNYVFWFSKTPNPKADNRKILRPYSDSMLELIEKGCKAEKRPSGHDISTNFQKDNGGAIPPNLITLANTESNSAYLQACKSAGIKPHPARFPEGLPRFFIEYLTDPGDLVLDPFAGSNTTGIAAECLGRNWVAVEMNLEYLEGSRYRFEQQFLV